jgi:hypothetical protein
MMEEMVEPDRTIMIVSIIGLIVIWGSFFYHKFVQGGAEAGDSEANAASGAVIEAGPLQGGQKKKKNKNTKKR